MKKPEVKCQRGCGGRGALVYRAAAVVRLLSHVRLFATPAVARQAFLSIAISLSVLRLTSFESVMPSNHLIFCRPLLLLSSIFPRIRVFSDELALHTRWPKYWSFSISPFNEYSGLISFRINWFDLLEVQRPYDLLWPIE